MEKMGTNTLKEEACIGTVVQKKFVKFTLNAYILL